jgi:hypothetical protein
MPKKLPLGAPKVVVSDLDASTVVRPDAQKAEKNGAGPMTVVVSGILAEGERVGAFVEVPSDVCLLAYGRGAPSYEDLDLSVFTDEGAPIVVDESPDAHPSVMLCPPHPERVYLSARASMGDGLVTIAAHLVPREHAVAVGRALGARGGGGEGSRPADWPGIDDVVRAHRDSLGGKWEEFRKVAVTVDPRLPTQVSFNLEPDQCVDGVFIPDDEVGTLEVEVSDDQGRSIARAKDGGRFKSLTVCSNTKMSASLALRPHTGRGLAAIVLARARGESYRDLADRRDVAWTGAALGLEEAMARRQGALVNAGYTHGKVVTQGKLLLGRRVSVPLEFKPAPGACERIDVMAGAPLSLVDGRIWDDRANLVASNTGYDGVTLFMCTKGRGHLDLDVHGRPGPFAVVARAEPWQSSAFAAAPLASARMLGRAAEGSHGVYVGVPVEVRSFHLDSEHQQVWDRTVSPAHCLRVVVGSEGDGMGLTLRLFDATTGEDLDRSQGTESVGAQVCAPSGEARRVRIELQTSTGRRKAIVGERLLQDATMP